MAEKIWMCSIYGKVERFQRLAPAGVTVGPGGKVTLSAQRLAESLFSDPYSAFVDRAGRVDNFVFALEPYATRDIRAFDILAQEFLNAAYASVRRQGGNPQTPPDFYAIQAPASIGGWPVYFFAVGMELHLPTEAYRGKIRLPDRPLAQQLSLPQQHSSTPFHPDLEVARHLD
jgi:hypothetical protein